MTNDLFTPLKLRETRLRNRVMVSPMCQYSCDNRDGIATDWHFVHLGSRAVGGAGIVMTEATAVEPRGRISPQDLGIWDAEHAEALAPIASFIRDQGSCPAIQLAHAGRKASKSRPWEGSNPLRGDEGWEVIAPSSIPWPYDGDAPPTRSMTQEDIDSVIDSFVAGAENALAAGFEICEIHAAHGYLLHEFLSPVTNQRTDDYGGSFENRSRIVREVTAAVRSVWPDDRPLFVRISATDWLPERDAWTVDQSVRLVDHLVANGADLIDVSGGAIHPDQQLPSTGPGYQIPYAEQIGEETTEDVSVGAVGAITEPEHADALIRTGQADLAIIGREHLRDPYFTNNAASKLEVDSVDIPPQYHLAYPEITTRSE